MILKCCPRRLCRGEAMMTQQVVEDLQHREKLGFRVICKKCGLMGPWGGETGLRGEMNAGTYWNEDYGRD